MPITIDADKLEGHASDEFPLKAEDSTISGAWTFTNNILQPKGRDIYPAGNKAGAQRRFDHFMGWEEHFDGDSIPPGWSWAGLPFVVPGHIGYSSDPSILTLGLTGATGSERAFLYRATMANHTYLQCAQMVASADSYTGLRLDDGSDDNYVEYVINMSAEMPSAWQLIVRHRIGGGAVTVVPAVPTTITVPTILVMVMQTTGSLYSDWGIVATIRGILSAGLSVMWQAATSGWDWTPTRRGIVVNKIGTATWYRHYIDSFTPN